MVGVRADDHPTPPPRTLARLAELPLVATVRAAAQALARRLVGRGATAASGGGRSRTLRAGRARAATRPR